MGNINAIGYKEIFKLIMENKIWLGINNGGVKWFFVPSDYDISTDSRKKIENKKKFFSLGNVFWYTNLYTNKEYKDIFMEEKYHGNESKYPKYDNYKEIINIDKVSKIPNDYKGVMGVPITFLEKYNPDQFELLGMTRNDESVEMYLSGNKTDPMVNGKILYHRIFIKNKRL